MSRPERQAHARPHTASADVRKRLQQEAGLAALISLAVSTASTVSMPAVPLPLQPRPVADYPPSDTLRPDAAGPDADAAPDRAPRLWTRLLTDHLVRNSLYLILSTGIQAALGSAFWIIAARLFGAEAVGRASSLISATGLIGYLALFGLNSALARYLATARAPNRLITAALVLVGVSGAGIGFAYVLLTPVIAPRLSFIAHSPLQAAGFAVLTGATAVNLLTDTVFVTSRKASYTALTDGGVGGVAKVAFAVALGGTGAYGLYCASVGGFAAAALASLVLMVTALRWRPSLRKPFQTLRPFLRFSAATYASAVLSMAPTMAVPLIALDRLGAANAGYYFVAFQMATLVYAAAYAVGQSFMAEGSHEDVDLRGLLKRSVRVLAALMLPAIVVLIAAAHWVLLAFGAKYSQHGTSGLIVLVAAALPVAANNWLGTVLRLLGRLRPVIVSSAVYALAVCGSAWFLSPFGLGALTSSWAIGSALAAAVSAGPCWKAIKSHGNTRRARHRRQDRPRPGSVGPATRRQATSDRRGAHRTVGSPR